VLKLFSPKISRVLKQQLPPRLRSGNKLEIFRSTQMDIDRSKCKLPATTKILSAETLFPQDFKGAKASPRFRFGCKLPHSYYY